MPTSSAGLLQQLQQQQQQQALSSAFDAALSAHMQTASSGLLPARNFSADATLLAAAAAAASQSASVQTSADSNVRKRRKSRHSLEQVEFMHAQHSVPASDPAKLPNATWLAQTRSRQRLHPTSS